jgi:superfamily II DNA or RNA helicase
MDRGQLVMACGTGKTLVGAFLTERMAAKRVLVLVPSLSLLGQTLREWATAIDFDYLAVCSDDTVAKDDHDAVVASTSELGVPVTTDFGRIASFLRKRGVRRRVIFSTYQSSPQIAVAQASRTPAFDLVIADEAHRCAGPVAGVFATVLDPTRIKGRKRMFMTATPRYFTGRVKREASEADWEVASMDEEAKFGPVMHRLTFGQAIEQELLSDYRVVVVGVSDSEAFDLATRGAFVTHDGHGVTDARTLARQIGLLRAMAKYDLRRVVTFHSRIDHARRFASSLPETRDWIPARRRPTGVLRTEHVSGKMTAGERDACLRRLKTVGDGERGVLTNARCLTEGVDVPTLDGVAFIDPRRSQVDVVQAVGRAIRRAEDKTLGSIVIPVLVAGDADPEASLESSEFDRVWEVVRALRDHDSDLAEALDHLRREYGARGSVCGPPRKIVLDLPKGVGDVFARAFDAKLVETTTAHWEFMFGVLERFVEREGSARVPALHSEGGVRIGSWVDTQRQVAKRGVLARERRERLESLPGWTWDPHADDWDEGYRHLLLYVQREGRSDVPASFVSDDGYTLGRWVSFKRLHRRQGRLSAERVARLEAIPGWMWDPRANVWDRSFEYLERFVERESHALVPSDHTEQGFRLGGWVVEQRVGKNRGQLSSQRLARLEALPGWSWDTWSDLWDARYACLVAFVEREGHSRVPNKWVQNGVPLGNWVGAQRAFFRGGSLAPDRVARLEALPGWAWNALDAQWERGFSLLVRYVERDGNARVHPGHVEDGYKLGRWVSKQRIMFKLGRISAERVRRLEALSGWLWDPRDSKWEAGFAQLLEFTNREGHARASSTTRLGTFELGKWVRVQRRRYAARELSADRIARLEALPGWTWGAAQEPLIPAPAGARRTSRTAADSPPARAASST